MTGKVSNIFFAFLLLLTTTGFTVSRHYCGTKLVSVAIDAKAKACCNDDKGNCCHNETELFQFREDFIAAFFQYNFQIDFYIDLNLNPGLLLNLHLLENNINKLLGFADNSPPPVIPAVLARLQAYLL